MKHVVLVIFSLLAVPFAQSRSPVGDFALILADSPVAQSTHSRAELRGSAAQAQLRKIRSVQRGVLAELQRRKVRVVSTAQVLANAVFVTTTPDLARGLTSIPGVAHVVFLPKVKRDLNTALGLENVTAAWSALGGASNAGTGIKIGIIDTGIDQNHPGFQDPSLTPPPGFPKGDSSYTNNKVIVARSYVALDNDSAEPQYSSPDDTTPRDRFGHGTAIAMIAAGVQNTGPVATIQGVAPKAFLGNYKVFGSPGVNDGAAYAAVHQALEDALSDGMDIVTLSLNEGSPVQYGPLDVDQTNCGGACDVYAQAVENAVLNGMVVVASAGNDGAIGLQPVTLGSIHTPGDAPSAITVGASTNAHLLYQAVHAGSKNFNALFDDGPHFNSPVSGKLVDVTQLGNDGLACSALPSGSLSGSIALVQRGTCVFSDKINNAQNAGAKGVIIYQQSGVETIYSSLGAQNTAIPAVMVGYTDGVSLKASAGSTAALDPTWTAVSGTPDVVAPYSSRGPNPALYGATLTQNGVSTLIIKPELVAVGDNLYTATQKLDPNGDAYDPTGYTGVSGTSYAVPMVAGAVALVKQKFPGFTPAQLKSAVVNTANTNVNDSGGVARVNSAGAGKLSVGDALNVAATIAPATLSFGALTAASLPAKLTLTVTNVGSATATFGFQVQQPLTPDSRASVSVSPSSLILTSGTSNSVSVSLTGSLPNAGSYEGSILVSGPAGSAALHVPYQYLVGTGVPYDIYSIYDGSFTGAPNDTNWLIGFRTVDQYGVRIPLGSAVQFGVVAGGGSIAQGDSGTDRLGDAFAKVNLGPNTGNQTFSGTAGSATVQFFGYARSLPVIANGGVGNAAPGGTGQGFAPGSYISIYGTNLADATLGEYTTELPVSMAQVNVTFDGGGLSLPGHLSYVSPGQVNVQIPWEFASQSSVQMKVVASFLYSALYTVPLANVSPGVFATTDPNYQSISAANPAKRGQTIILFANGLGAVDTPQVSGVPASSTQLVNTTTKASVTIGSLPAEVDFSGLAPGLVGCYQVNAVVPSGASSGTQPMVVSVNGVASAPINLVVQ